MLKGIYTRTWTDVVAQYNILNSEELTFSQREQHLNLPHTKQFIAQQL